MRHHVKNRSEAIYAVVTEAMAKGETPPSYRQLSERFGCSVPTVNRALRLAREHRLQGSVESPVVTPVEPTVEQVTEVTPETAEPEADPFLELFA